MCYLLLEHHLLSNVVGRVTMVFQELSTVFEELPMGFQGWTKLGHATENPKQCRNAHAAPHRIPRLHCMNPA